ncbi:MAG: NADH dehydrogenase (quinone) subunit D [Planctomycetes bacterium]|nr:NADH dehydrogenase (quinone) subunit D [Planctomycetota bacterium]
MTVETRDYLDSRMHISIGPSHPATHGTLRFHLDLDGETIVKCVPEIGYLHRAFEKSAEKGTYTQVIPYTDRLNYCSSMMNNVGYCQAVERLMGLQIPERAVYIRVIISELARIMDHLVCVGTNAVDIGALTNFWYFFRAREDIYELIEALCGARLTTTYTRIGGLAWDAPPGWADRLKAFIEKCPKTIEDVEGLLAKNRVFIDRTKGIGAISKEKAVSYGFTGPCLRATGVKYDVRRDRPYLCYDRFQFEIPTHTAGDTYARFLVRMEEMRQSLRILQQAVKDLPGGPVLCDDPAVALPPKSQVYTNIEAIIRQFKLVIEGVKPRKGEVYDCTEAANGELGFLVVSDGTGKPWRVRVRPPCFCFLAAFPEMVEGQMLADLIATLGSINIIAGELDR